MDRLLMVAASGSQPPAQGAAIGQVIGATLGMSLVTFGLFYLFHRLHTGRAAPVRRLADRTGRQLGVPGWAALPSILLVGVSLLVAVYGMYWDISIHLNEGRDPGPLANAAHYFILAGLFGVFASAVIAVALTGDRRPSPSAVRLPGGLWAPLGAVVIFACGSVSLAAFPLDDVWHRIFGQDVTLWGPTHLLLIGGAAFSIIGAWILHAEGVRATDAAEPEMPSAARLRDLALTGSFLVGLSTFQAEFDFGVPQFRAVWQPLLLALAAGIGLVAARVLLGRGGALAAAAFFIVLRGGLDVIVGPVLGHTAPHFPLYLAEAAIVEGVALRYGRERPIALGAVAGLLIGTIGFAFEDAWQHAIAYIPWSASLIVEGLICATVAGIAGGVLGGWIGRSVAGLEGAERAPRWAVPAAGVAAVAVMAWALPMPNGSPPRATVSLTDVGSGPQRHVIATARLTPPDAAEHARWFVVTAWQGGGAVVAPMKRIGDGVYRATRPVPVWGPKWKTTLRMQRGGAVLGMPIYMPEDKAIPVKGIPASTSFTRPFQRDKKLLQREQKSGIPGFLTLAAYLAVLAIWSGMVAVAAWALVRLARTRRDTGEPPLRTGRFDRHAGDLSPQSDPALSAARN